MIQGAHHPAVDKLSKTKEMTFDQIRKALGFLDSIPFNLEGGKRTKLQGMVTRCDAGRQKTLWPGLAQTA